MRACSHISDAGWLRQLHAYGLLRVGFRPDVEIATLRAYPRQRERLVEYAAAHIQHMRKALMEMNLQLRHVVSDITGATGMRIIRAIVAGERDPDVLAAHRDARCHASTATIRAALVGNDRDEHVFALTQALELYDTYQEKMRDCDRELEATIAGLTKRAVGPVGDPPKARVRARQVNGAVLRRRGRALRRPRRRSDPDPRPGALARAEAGRRMRRGPARLAEGQAFHLLALSGAGQQDLGRQAAVVAPAALVQPGGGAVEVGGHPATTIRRSDTALGAFYRRLSARIGKAKAITAAARKIAVLFYNTLRHGMAYKDPGAAQYEERHRTCVLANLQRRAKALGFAPRPPTRAGCFLGIRGIPRPLIP